MSSNYLVRVAKYGSVDMGTNVAQKGQNIKANIVQRWQNMPQMLHKCVQYLTNFVQITPNIGQILHKYVKYKMNIVQIW